MKIQLILFSWILVINAKASAGVRKEDLMLACEHVVTARSTDVLSLEGHTLVCTTHCADGAVPVTGATRYSVQDIAKTLAISSDDIINRTKMSGDLSEYVVVSVGEGTSGLVPMLRNVGLSAFGVDLWYDLELPAEMDFTQKSFYYRYLAEHREYLIGGDATSLPLRDNSVDLILSHAVIGHLRTEHQALALKDMYRVLKRGAELRVGPVSQYIVEQMWPHLLGSLSPLKFTFSPIYSSKDMVLDLPDLDDATKKQIAMMGVASVVKR